jgi:hypothetical protein
MKQLNEYENGTQALVYINGINGLCFVNLQSKTFSGHVFLESINSMDPNFSRGSVIPVECKDILPIEIFTQELKDHGKDTTVSQKESKDHVIKKESFNGGDFAERDPENRHYSLSDELRERIALAFPSLMEQKITIVQQPKNLSFDLIGDEGDTILRLRLSDAKLIGEPLLSLLSSPPYSPANIVKFLGAWCNRYK